MSIEKNSIYIKYKKEIKKTNLNNELRVQLFLNIIPYYLNNELNVQEFSGLVADMYFRKDGTGIGEEYPLIDWLMYFGADALFKEEKYKERLKRYNESPDEFKKWWKENINVTKK